jgi:hypothetical protein
LTSCHGDGRAIKRNFSVPEVSTKSVEEKKAKKLKRSLSALSKMSTMSLLEKDKKK